MRRTSLFAVALLWMGSLSLAGCVVVPAHHARVWVPGHWASHHVWVEGHWRHR
jgi:hypothetical protein